MSESPPVLVGERVFWLGSGSGLPKAGLVKWLGKLAEIGPGWAVGVELEEELPCGGMDGSWRGRRLFSCREKRGLIVPAAGLLPAHRRHSGHQSVTEESRRTPKGRRRGQRAGAGAAIPDKEADGTEELVGEKDADLRTESTLEGRLGGRSEECGLRKEGAASWMVEDQDVEVLLRRRRLNRSVGEGLDSGSHRDSFHSGRSSRNRHSGLFGLLKWFRKERSEEDSWEPGSPVLARPSLSGSVDTLFSTASSFAFVKPQQFRQYGLSSQPRARLFASETNTFRNRICERERLRRIDNNVSLREKYGLYECGTLPRSVDHIDEISVEIKKRRAPPPPETRHRRTLSEPVKVHVKGKRKAPPPPGFEDIISISTSNSNSSKRSRKKRRAPSPPKKVESGYANGITNDDTISNASTVDIGSLDVVCTDTLKLERGVLKPNMEKTYAEPKVCPSSPVSPRPWYKRTASRDTNSKDRKKDRDRRKVEDWMLESGIPRKSLLNNENRFNIFTKLDKTEDKRRSQISILTNISELDREAAEIIKRGKEREKNLMESHNAKFYNETGNTLAGENGAVKTSTPQNTQRSSARDLLSLLNAITNVTRAAVNASLEEQEKQQSTQNKFQVPKDQAIKVESFDEVVYKLYPKKEEEPRPSSSSAASSSSTGKIARVTIEELEEFDAERNPKAQAIFEANKQNRQQQQPAIPTIAEVSEKSTKTTPEPTLTETKGSASANQLKPSQVPHMKNLNVWVCPRCTLENLRWRITCEACDMWRPNPFELRERTFKDQNNESDKKEIEKEKPNFITKLNPSNIESKPSTKSLFAKTELPESKIEKKEAMSVPTIQDVVTPRHTPTNERMSSKSETNIVNSLALIGTNTGNVKPQTVETKNKDCASALPPSSQNEKIIEIKIQESKDLNKEAVANDEVSRKVEINEEGSRDSSPDSKTDEVRKARLAFFTKNQASTAENKESIRAYDAVTSEPMRKDEAKKEEVEQKPNDAEEKPKRPSVKIYREDSEKQKLKEMLIEMKHSLPKRGSRKSQGQTSDESTDDKAPQEAQKPKVPENSLKQTIDSNKGFAEAYLVESQTIVEEIKYKKPSEKVSSAAQTSGLVTQLAPKVVPSSGKELVIPVKVEEHTIKDGVLYTSTSKGVKKIGSGTFQLLRARDFADIKNVKGGKEVPLPVYVNVAEDGNRIEDIDKISKQLVAPQGVAIFRAGLGSPEDKSLNTMAVNRLLKRLEVAIAGGNHELAAALARELAQLKVSCSVVRQKPNINRNEILVELYVEDKTSHQGPFHLKLTPNMTVGELRDLVQAEYEIPTEVQRWILANKLASDDTASLGELGVTEGTPIFLYLVAPEQPVKTEPLRDEAKPSTSGVSSGKQNAAVDRKEATPPKNEKLDPIPVPGPSGVKVTKPEEQKVLPTEKAEKPPTVTSETGWRCDACTLVNSCTGMECAACGAPRPNPQDLAESKVTEAPRTGVNLHKPVKVEEEKGKNYQKLIDLEKDDLIVYTEEFECPVCLVEYPPMEGILLRECLHVFCRNCLAHTVHFSDEAEVKCPFRDDNYTCDSTLLEREIKAIVTPQEYEEHLAKSIALAETKIGNTFHCKTPDCKGWCIYEDNVNIFKCPVCTHSNCLTCQAIHEGLNCKQYQEQLNSNSEMSVDVKRTKEMLQEMVSRGEAMNCPTCQVVLMKKWGCDWLRCSMCKTEICWITRGPRWGPNGKGDTSGGCQCGVNGVKCHPKCTYCH